MEGTAFVSSDMKETGTHEGPQNLVSHAQGGADKLCLPGRAVSVEVDL